MSDNEVAIIVVAIVFGSILTIVGIIMMTKLIKAWINRNKNTYDEEKFERLAKAFIKFKKDSDLRFKKLEKTLRADETKPTFASEQPDTGNKINNRLRSVLKAKNKWKAATTAI